MAAVLQKPLSMEHREQYRAKRVGVDGKMAKADVGVDAQGPVWFAGRKDAYDPRVLAVGARYILLTDERNPWQLRAAVGRTPLSYVTPTT